MEDCIPLPNKTCRLAPFMWTTKYRPEFSTSLILSFFLHDTTTFDMDLLAVVHPEDYYYEEMQLQFLLTVEHVGKDLSTSLFTLYRR